MRRVGWILIAGLLLACWAWTRIGPSSVPAGGAALPQARTTLPTPDESIAPESLPPFLPAEARDTLRRIARGGAFPHRQDGDVFHNRERLLPPRPRGYYREYTVRTPGARDRGARRIVSGGDPPVEYFYTDDHYRSFRRFRLPARPSR